jgi:hypothetical protein
MTRHFNEDAGAIVVQAYEPTIRIGHPCLGGERLLLALAAAGQPAGAVLRGHDVTPERTEAEIVSLPVMDWVRRMLPGARRPKGMPSLRRAASVPVRAGRRAAPVRSVLRWSKARARRGQGVAGRKRSSVSGGDAAFGLEWLKSGKGGASACPGTPADDTVLA